MNSATCSRRMTRRAWVRRGVVSVAAVAVATTGYHLLWRQHVKRFQVVRAGVLYRVAQPSEMGLRYLVSRHQVRTVLNLRMEDAQVRQGWLALGKPRGAVESECVANLGAQYLSWHMGDETYWPWVTPWQFEEFFRIVDNPDNHPIAVHCMGGRHRTGTLAALFRLEYDRWPIERVLEEMYSFDFGQAMEMQDFNLRTYTPRPVPNQKEWPAIAQAWQDLMDQPANDYGTLVRRLRDSTRSEAVRHRLIELLERESGFALPLAVRLIDQADDPAANAAAKAAMQRLETRQATFADHYAAAALVADFGDEAQQNRLLEIVREEMRAAEVSPRYRAVAAGLANRYTTNRIPLLAPLLEDERAIDGTWNVRLRYCDLASMRIGAILDVRFLHCSAPPLPAEIDRGRAAAKNWLAAHQDYLRLARVTPPVNDDLESTVRMVRRKTD